MLPDWEQRSSPSNSSKRESVTCYARRRKATPGRQEGRKAERQEGRKAQRHRGTEAQRHWERSMAGRAWHGMVRLGLAINNDHLSKPTAGR